MVKIMENPIKMDDLGENPLFLETPTCFEKVWTVFFVLIQPFKLTEAILYVGFSSPC